MECWRGNGPTVPDSAAITFIPPVPLEGDSRPGGYGVPRDNLRLREIGLTVFPLYSVNKAGYSSRVTNVAALHA